jgi:hypothetical protein
MHATSALEKTMKRYAITALFLPIAILQFMVLMICSLTIGLISRPASSSASATDTDQMGPRIKPRHPK